MSFTLKSSTAPQISELAASYLKQYGIGLLNQLLILQYSKITLQEQNYKFVIDKQNAQLIKQNMSQWKIVDYVVQSNNHQIRYDELQFYQQQKQKIIIKTLYHISFPYLQQLVLINCKINSIQALQFMDMPHIVRINLQSNKITTIRPIIKLNYKYLFMIILTRNLIRNDELRYLSRMKSIQKQILRSQTYGCTIQQDFSINYCKKSIWIDREDFSLQQLSQTLNMITPFHPDRQYENKHDIQCKYVSRILNCKLFDNESSYQGKDKREQSILWYIDDEKWVKQRLEQVPDILYDMYMLIMKPKQQKKKQQIVDYFKQQQQQLQNLKKIKKENKKHKHNIKQIQQ